MGKVRTSDPNEAVGASLVHPDNLVAAYDEQTFDGTYGYVLWKREQRSAQHYEGGSPVVRVALAYDLDPGQIERTVQEKREAYSDLPKSPEEVSVGGRKLQGVAIQSIPGSIASSEVYVPVDERVYQIKIYKERLDTEAKELLASMEFSHVSQSVDSLALPDASDPETFYEEGDQEQIEPERSARAEERAKLTPEEALEAVEIEEVEEDEEVEGGCRRAASSFFFQTQHGMYANSSKGGIDTAGYTIVGRPNYWGDYTHGALGYGRCANTYYTNDMFAVDFPLERGDAVFSPFKKAKVTWAGRHPDYINYGIFVVTQAYDSAGRPSPYKYWNLSAHLSALKKGIRPGAIVTDEDIIGYAGATGDPSIPVGEPHLHSAFYRSPQDNGGRPYGGQGLQVIYHHYVGTAAGTGPGIYTFGWKATSTTKAQGSRISN